MNPSMAASRWSEAIFDWSAAAEAKARATTLDGSDEVLGHPAVSFALSAAGSRWMSVAVPGPGTSDSHALGTARNRPSSSHTATLRTRLGSRNPGSGSPQLWHKQRGGGSA